MYDIIGLNAWMQHAAQLPDDKLSHEIPEIEKELNELRGRIPDVDYQGLSASLNGLKNRVHRYQPTFDDRMHNHFYNAMTYLSKLTSSIYR